MKKIACIPARYDSSRLKGKLLLDLGGKTIIERVAEAVNGFKGFDEVVVLTDHELIAEAVSNIEVQCIMTSTDCNSGTERLISVLPQLEGDIIINVQGDEPFINNDHLESILGLMEDEAVSIGTLCHKIQDNEHLFNYNHVKVVFNKLNRALYFSRQAIPAIRDEMYKDWILKYPYYRHIGIYGYKRAALEKIGLMKGSELEDAEKLEQLKWMDNGLDIHVKEVIDPPITGIDTDADYERARQYLSNS
ncbi:MAG: 3-deoxy-manno-octulosonate cytidylyltransferase [Saprospiraceae bacterium]|nr:3-deoxy-manno-octulosonate cytidylyltransferase [Saprospiraceae bacterium]